MAVPPIHARDVYVLSPNCDLGNLDRASAAFAQTFTFAPPMSDLLASLSTAPRPYKSFCPTKSLRPAYLRILAWLIRGGWVCQICTFAYVVVWPEVQYEVEYSLESEALARIKKARQGGRNGKGGREHVSLATDANQHPGDTSDDNDVDGDSSSVASHALSLSPSSAKSQNRDAVGGDSRPRPSAAEHAAERARQQRIAEKAARDLAERATIHARKPVPTRTEHPSVNDAVHLVGMLPYIIIDASKPTGRESLYLSAIETRLRSRRIAPPPASKKDGNITTSSAPTMRVLSDARTGQGDEFTAWNGRVADMWPVFWKYFNGRSALERIPLLEDIKRKEVWNLLSAMSEFLLCVRHW